MYSKRSLTTVAGIGSIAFLVLYVLLGFKLFKESDVFAGHEACRTGSHSQILYSSDFIFLHVKNDIAGKVRISGGVNVSKATYDALKLERHPLRLRLEPLQLSYSIFPPFPEEVELGDWTTSFEGPHANAFVDLKPKLIKLYGDASDFPFEHFRYGYRAVLYINTPVGVKDLSFKNSFTNIDLSSFFVPKVSSTTFDYMGPSDSSLVTADDNRVYRSGECAVKIERSFSFKLMVVLLTLFLFLPVIYSLFRTDKQPSLDVIATVVSVAAIRMFLIGPVEDFQFYKIDFVFGLAIVLSATVPLILGLWQGKPKT
ncbi:hypothetical protein FGA82_03530 [Pseudomonas fluorescens]|uniref:hypothetical protein n=1 Tax=Pseudomonas fluorescens TaxID=294 RepID=UPI00113009CD|nr:hypothetical protein [Pseudomonas fluorescens]TMU82581.1 hypothetical protein FGA82_03530 [Pseudomonas fluorescens]